MTLTLADQLEDLLPQTQCTKCGYPACRPYAEAIAADVASYNRCPPGGEEGIVKLVNLLNKPFIPLDTSHGQERVRTVAIIAEADCIGCTLCIQACPVDAIIGAAKQMHTVIPQLCTGCDLCVAPCPVDCITMVDVTPGLTGWNAWTQQQADQARQQFHFRQKRLESEKQENEARLLIKAENKFIEISAQTVSGDAEIKEKNRKKSIILAAIERATQKQKLIKNIKI